MLPDHASRIGRGLFRASSDAMFLLDASSLLDANPAAERLTGCPRERLLSRDVRSWFVCETPLDLAANTSVICHLRATDGRCLPVVVEILLLDEESPPLTLLVVRDRGELRRAEDALRSCEEHRRRTDERFHQVVESNLQGILIHQDDRIRYANPAIARIFGLANAAELVGFPVWGTLIEPADEPMLRQRTAALYRGETVPTSQPWRGRRKDGTTVWFTSMASRIEWEGRPAIVSCYLDVTERMQVEESFQASRQVLRLVLDNIPQGVFWKDVHSRYLGCNRVVSQAFGLDSSEQIVGLLDAQLPGLTEDQADYFIRKDREVMRTNTPEYNIVEPATLADGSSIWIETCKMPLHDARGAVVGVLGTWQDITQRKRQEEALVASLQEKEALLKEIHHRVKNNLQIITSLLNLQAQALTDQPVLDVFAETRHRVRSMALLHETLYRSGNLARIDFRQYASSLCTHLFRSYGVDPARIGLQIHVADVPLQMDQAIPCGLIINELVSNALKYAFPGERSGQLVVCLEGGAEGCTLTVSDDGVGLPALPPEPRAGSLGLQLVRDLAQQLRGSLAVGNGPGATFTLTFRP